MENKQVIFIALIAILFGGLVTWGLFILEDKQETKEAEIYFNGTNQGATNVVNFIAQNKAVPFFQEDGNVSYVTFTQLCEQLNGGQS